MIVCGVQGPRVRVVDCRDRQASGRHHRNRRTGTASARGADTGCPYRCQPRNPESLWAGGSCWCFVRVCRGRRSALSEAALLQELAPQTRVIVRQSNPAVGRAITSAIPRGLVVNPADLAAPTLWNRCWTNGCTGCRSPGTITPCERSRYGRRADCKTCSGSWRRSGHPPRRDDCGLPES